MKIFLLIFASFIKLNATQNFIVENYNRKDYNSHSQNWAIDQNKQGNIVVGNHTGLIIYTGGKWIILEVPNLTVRSLLVDESGVIYVGGVRTFGYLLTDKNYNYSYISFSDELDKSDQEFKEIWQIIKIGNSVYFSSFEGIFELKNNAIKKIYHKRILNSFSVKNTLYTQDFKTQDLIEYNGVSFNQISNGELKGKYLMSMLPHNKKILLSTYQNGFHLLDSNKISKMRASSDNMLRKLKISMVIKNSKDNYIVGSRFNGIFMLDKELTLIKHINETNGLQNNTINFIFEDLKNDLWLGSNNGISKISFTPLTRFSSSVFKNNSTSYITTINIHKLLLANDIGLHIVDKEGKFVESVISNAFVSHVLKVKNKYIISTKNGLYSYTGNRAIQYTQEPVRYTHRSKFYNNTILYIRSKNLYLENHNSRKVVTLKVSGVINTICEILPGELWLGTNNSGGYRVNYQDLERITVKKIKNVNGFKLLQVHFYDYDNQLFITAPNLGLYRLEKDKFIPETRFGKQFSDGTRSVLHLSQDSFGNFWFVSELKIFQAIKEEDGTYTLNERIFNTLPKVQTTVIYPDSNGVMWIANEEGLVKYDPSIKIDIDRSFPVNITKVSLNQDSILYGGAFLSEKGNYKSAINYGQNQLRFEYAAAFFKMPEKTRYSYKLDGYDKDWSSYSRETIKDYTSLYEGDYTFYVKAKNVYDTEGQIAKYSFTVFAPWYRTWYMYLVYTVFSILTFITIVKFVIAKKMKRLNELRKIELAEARARELEMKSRFEKEHLRNRISQDLHDEIGSNLSYIRLSADLLERQNPQSDIKNNLKQIGKVAYDSASAMRDIVWFVNPENDSFEKFIKKITETTQLMMTSFDLDYKVNISDYEVEIDLNSKRNLFLMIKEAYQNIIKHSSTKHVNVEISVKNGLFSIYIKDDGIGFNKNQLSSGNGLSNFEKRAQKISAKLEIESSEGFGTSISIRLPIIKKIESKLPEQNV